MKKVMKKYKGVTMLELTIVLALLGLITTLLVSFSALVKSYTTASVTDEAVLTDLGKIKNIFDTWANSVDNDNMEIYVSNGNRLTAKNKTTLQEYSLLLTDDGTFVGSFPDEDSQKTLIYEGVNRINSMTFNIIEGRDTNDSILLKLTVLYSHYNSSGSVEQSGMRVFFKSMRAAKKSGGA